MDASNYSCISTDCFIPSLQPSYRMKRCATFYGLLHFLRRAHQN